MLMTVVLRGRGLMAVTILALLLGCGEANHEDKIMTSAVQISAAEWQALAQKRVVFGHQSVGQNILDGVQALAAQANISLPIVKSRTPEASNGIFHFFVGQNEDPLSKLKDFAGALESGAAEGTGIALLKLCYIDFRCHHRTAHRGTDGPQGLDQTPVGAYAEWICR